MIKNIIENYKFEGRVDKSNNRIIGNAVLTPISANGRFYNNSALKSIVPLINGAKSFIDHADSPFGSSVLNLLGEFSNGRLDGRTVRADLTIFESSKGKDLIFDLAENHPTAVGFSINAKGKFAENRDSDGREVVEEIISLKSIDLVGYPATTSSIFESKLKDYDQHIKIGREEFWDELNEQYCKTYNW